MINMLKKLGHYIVNFIFPKRCVICDEVLRFGKGIEAEYICEKCKNKIEFIDDLSCKKCGAKINDNSEYYCERCKSYKNDKKSYYEFGFGLCRYNDAVKVSIHRLKYRSRPEYLELYGKLIATRFFERFKKMDIDCFVPVPIHKKRYLERSYNQAEILAKHISKYLENENLDIPVNTSLIYRVKKTEILNKLSENDRKEALKNVFEVDNSDDIRNVCIVDDIYTTGSTIENMSKILKENGVEKIYFVTIAVVDNL